MIKILFICHGNICRSPMAQCVFTQMVKELGREKEFQIDSMATSYEEHGNPIYPPARRIMPRPRSTLLRKRRISLIIYILRPLGGTVRFSCSRLSMYCSVRSTL